MARGKTPRKAKDLNFEAVGVKGRRTGTQLPDPGIRDEDGLEPIPSFSSPVKAVRPNGVPQEATYTADDTMDIGISTITEPELVVRSVRNEKARLSIPRSISPRKSLIHGSPRRSMPRIVGPMSSPSTNLNKGTPTRFSSHPPANRKLDFSVDKAQSSVTPAWQKFEHSSRPDKRVGRKGKKAGPFDLSASEDEDDENDEESKDVTDAALTNGHEDYMTTGADDAMMQGQEDEQENTMQSIEQDDPMPDIEEVDASAGATVPEKKKQGRKPRNVPARDPDESAISLSAPGPSRRGRPPKNKKPSKNSVKASEQVTGPPRAKGKRKDPPAQESKARAKIAKTATRAPSVRAGSVGPRASHFVSRAETPATDAGALVTRSGRHSYKPLASWRGEKVVFGQRSNVDSVAGITDIIRTDEIMGPPKKKPSRRPGRARAASQLADVEEEEEEMEEWERDSGIMQALVMHWDSELNKYREDETEETEIAYAADAIEMRDIAGASFKFAKTLTLPFFGSGMVHLPPGGEKRIKNSRKMQMVFFVVYGRVTVSVGTPTTVFSIGKGGQWQVPRGNFYSIYNESDTQVARMFFAQGCEWSPEIAEEAGAAAE